jgi:ABC-type transport system involved in multi-copper enzyme maturation permease subunit
MSTTASTFRALTVEACADAMRRRIVPVIGVISLLSLLAVDGCTSCSSGQLDLNGQQVAIGDVAGWTGLVIFTVLALWTMILAGVIASDHLSHPLSDGSAALALARPLTRDTFALSRLAGALAIAWTTGAVLLGGTTVLLALRAGASPGAALWAGLACAAGAFTVACLSMTCSLWLPQIATTLLVFATVGAIAVVNAVAQFSQEMTGVMGVIEHYGPPLASSVVVALAPWIEPTEVKGAALPLALRSLAWCAASAGLLILSFRRLELGR